MIVIVDTPGDGADFFCFVAAAFHIGQHLGNGQQRTQVDRGRLVPRKDLRDFLVDLDLMAIDFFFAIKHALDQRHISCGQRVDRVLDHRLDYAAHLQKLRADTLQIDVKLLVGVLSHPDTCR